MINTSHDAAQFVLDVARTGGRYLLMGPNGSGKTMIARRIAQRVRMTDDQRIEASIVRHATGLDRHDDTDLMTSAPFRAPHHTCSTAALVGGGRPFRPGECSLAHGGALFLDELPEFRWHTLHATAHTLDEGIGNGVPCRPHVFIGGATRCPCGYEAQPRFRLCKCSPESAERYRERVSRYADMFELTTIHVTPVSREALMSGDTIDAALDRLEGKSACA